MLSGHRALPDITLRHGTILRHCRILRHGIAKVSIIHDGGISGVQTCALDAGAMKALAVDTFPISESERVAEVTVTQPEPRSGTASE